jgi:hypothetical protein
VSASAVAPINLKFLIGFSFSWRDQILSFS